MGNPQRLSGRAPRAVGPAWARHALFGAGVLGLVLVCLAASLVTWVLLPALVLRWSPTVVVSGSMRPAVDVGDVVLMRPVGGEDLAAPTVVLYDGGPGTGRIVHRVVAQLPDGAYVTQGDANPTPDADAVGPGQVRGAAVLMVPWVGLPAVWVVQERWLLLAAGAAGTLACLRVSAFAFDPAYDPWSGARRVLPVTVLQAAPARGPGAGQGATAPWRLLDPDLRDVVLERLVEQSADARARRADLAPVPG